MKVNLCWQITKALLWQTPMLALAEMHRLRRQLGSLAMGARLLHFSPMTVRLPKGTSVLLS